MIAHLKTLLNVSGIAKRNGRLTLARAGNISANSLMSRLICPLNHLLRPLDIRIPCQKIVCRLWRYAFSLFQQPASTMPL